MKSRAEKLLYADLCNSEIPPAIGHQFHPVRKWRFDFAYTSIKLAIEVDGKGRHQTDKGKREDDQKLNAALEMGWRVLRYSASSVATCKRRERIAEQIKRCVCGVASPEDAEIVLVGD